MFRIDKSLVNLANARSVHVEGDMEAAGAEGEHFDVPAASASVELAVQEILGAAEEQAAHIIENAKDEAMALMSLARKQAEEDRNTASREGYAKGEKEGRQAFDAKLKEDDEKLKRVIEELYDERKRLYDSIEDNIAALSLDIVRKIINPAEEALGGVFMSLVSNALKQIKLTDRIIIRVGPSEYERFFSSGNAVFDLQSGVIVTATVLKDMSFNDGDCVIDTDFETVNAGLESQLKYIQLAFEEQ